MIFSRIFSLSDQFASLFPPVQVRSDNRRLEAKDAASSFNVKIYKEEDRYESQNERQGRA